MIKRMAIMLVAVGVVFGAIFGFQAFKSKMIRQAMASMGAPPQTVSTTTARSQQWLTTLKAVGSARAVNGANLSAQVSGIVAAVHFESGADVKEGAPLIELTAADDIAHLEALKATAALAKITYERDLALVKTKAVSQQTVDADQWALKNDQAQVAQQQALVDYKFIKAPFSGRLGIRQVDLGQYLAAGSTIVTLQQIDPIYADFYLPQQTLAQVRIGQRMTAKTDTYPDMSFDGEVSAINPLVDIATRNVQVRATIKNPDQKLLPGMFLTVDIDIGEPRSYVTLPQTAIAYNSYGNIAYIVDERGKDSKGQPQLFARQIFVTTGETRGDQVAVVDGVKDGDVVVTAGQIKLRNGVPLLINNSVQPTDNPDPKPRDQ